MLTEPVGSPPQLRRWSRDEYLRMADEGFFEGQRVELVEGMVVEMTAMNSPHWAAQLRTRNLLQRLCEPEFVVTTNAPLDLSPISLPEPDVAVIPGRVDDYVDRLPNSALLVVEIADTSLAYDRVQKESLYASAGIPEYWIVNLTNSTLEVRRNPVPDERTLSGYGYAELRILTASETVALSIRPDVEIPVSDLLPPRSR